MCQHFDQLGLFTVVLLIATAWNAASIGSFAFLLFDIRNRGIVVTLLISGSFGLALICLWALVVIGACK